MKSVNYREAFYSSPVPALRKRLHSPVYVTRRWLTDETPEGQKIAANFDVLYNAPVVKRAKDGSSITVQATIPCQRCGGSGMMPFSAFNGVCLRCHRRGTEEARVKLYTRAKLAQLDAKAAAKQAAREAEARAKKSVATAANAALLGADLLAAIGQWIADTHAAVDWQDAWATDEHIALLERDVIGDDRNGYQAKRNIAIYDLGCKASRETLTEKQAAYLAQLWAGKQGEAAAQQAAEAAKVDVPEGKQRVSGVVVSTRETSGPYGSEYKMLVDCGGFKLWGTVPRALAIEEELKGKTVSFNATVTAKEKGFGYFSRPTKAAVAA